MDDKRTMTDQVFHEEVMIFLLLVPGCPFDFSFLTRSFSSTFLPFSEFLVRRCTSCISLIAVIFLQIRVQYHAVLEGIAAWARRRTNQKAVFKELTVGFAKLAMVRAELDLVIG